MKHLEQFNPRKLRVLYALSFLFSISIAFAAYAQSSYLETLLPKESVGLVFVTGYLLTLLALTRFGNVVARLGKRNTVLLLLAISIVSLFFLMNGYSRPVLLTAFVFYIIMNVLVLVGMDVLIETYSSDGETGRIRGTYLTIMNAGWVVAPAASGFILEQFGFHLLFKIAMFFVIPVFCIFFVAFRGMPRHEKVFSPPFLTTLKTVFSRRALSHIFIISFLLHFFYAWMVIYTPLYLVSLGIDWSDIGKIFSVMLLPFVIFEYPAGVIADRWLGEKEMLTAGLLIIAVSTVALYTIEGPVLWLWALLLFATRIGASLIEVMRDVYFFKQVDKRDVHIIDFFRNAYPLAYMVAPLLASAILVFAPMQILFLVLGIIMFFGTVFALRLVDTK